MDRGRRLRKFGSSHRQCAQSLGGPAIIERSREIFPQLGVLDGRLTTEQIQGPRVAAWFRALIGESVANGLLPPSKPIRTCRLVALLAAKAEGTPNGCVYSEEFDACTRVLTGVSGDWLLEEELAWALLDPGDVGRVWAAEAAATCCKLWAALGICLGDAAADEVIAAANAENQGWLTTSRYRAWFHACCRLQPCGIIRGRATPREARTAGQLPDYFPSCGSRCMDQLLRSTEVGALSLFGAGDRDIHGSLLRPLTPSRPSTSPRRPLADDGAVDAAAASKAAASAAGAGGRDELATPRRLPHVQKVRGKDAAPEEWWNRIDNRLRPYMRMNASYLRKDGVKAEAVGTLIAGWRVPNTAVVIPYSKAPEGARLKEAAKRPGVDDEVVVLIDGIERLLPREAVSPAT